MMNEMVNLCFNLNIQILGKKIVKIRKINARERSQKCFRTIIKLVKCTIITKIGLKILFNKSRGDDDE